MQVRFPKLRRWSAGMLIGCCAVVSVPTAHAASITLAELISTNGKIVSGDKEFSDFAYLATGDMPLAEFVNVAMFEDESGNFGLRFQGGFLDSPDPLNQASDALISYRVRVTDPERLISDAHLAANLVAHDGGTATITETFLPIFPSTAEVLRIPTPDGSELIDGIIFDEPVRELVAQKNILMVATTSQVDMSFVDQTFSQVPEPTGLGLAAMGFLGMLATRVLRGSRR